MFGLLQLTIRCADPDFHKILKEAGFVIDNNESNPILVIASNAEAAEGLDWIAPLPKETLVERMYAKLNIVVVQPGPVAR